MSINSKKQVALAWFEVFIFELFLIILWFKVTFSVELFFSEHVPDKLIKLPEVSTSKFYFSLTTKSTTSRRKIVKCWYSWLMQQLLELVRERALRAMQLQVSPSQSLAKSDQTLVRPALSGVRAARVRECSSRRESGAFFHGPALMLGD